MPVLRIREIKRRLDILSQFKHLTTNMMFLNSVFMSGDFAEAYRKPIDMSFCKYGHKNVAIKNSPLNLVEL